MHEYSISRIMIGGAPNPPDALSAVEFLGELEQRWSVVEVQPATDPHNPNVLYWRIQIDAEGISGKLGRNYYRIVFTSTPQNAATFAVWYRQLIAPDIPLIMFLHETASLHEQSLSLTPTTTEPDILFRLPISTKRPRKESTHAWRLTPGGHLGRLGPHAAITGIVATPDGELWVRVGPGGSSYIDGQWTLTACPALFRYTGDVWEQVTGLLDPEWTPTVWYQQRLWGLGSAGLAMFDRGNWILGGDLPFTNPWPAYVMATTSDYLWVGTSGQGLWRTHDGSTWEPMALPGRNATISALWSKNDMLWVAEHGGKPANRPIHVWHNDTWEALPVPSKHFYHLSALTTDRAGHLWVGSNGRGVWRWAAGDWTHFSGTVSDDKPGLPGGWISGLCVDQHNRVWAATHIGIGLYDEQNWRWVMVAPEPPSHEQVLRWWNPSPTQFTLDHGGRLWIGTGTGDVGWIDTTEPLYPPQPLYPDAKSSILTEYQPLQRHLCETQRPDYPVPLR